MTRAEHIMELHDVRPKKLINQKQQLKPIINNVPSTHEAPSQEINGRDATFQNGQDVMA
jgi:hypothetical protein